MMLVPMLAAMTTLVATPAVAAWLRRRGKLDVPNARSSHTSAVPRGGGLACAAGVAAGWALASWQSVELRSVPLLLAAAAVVVMAAVGLTDDFLTLSPKFRLGMQLLAGGLVGVGMGPWWLLLGGLAFAVLVNTVNFMDGINGITAVTMMVFGASLALLCHRHGSAAGVTIGLVTAGTAAGFLPWNAPRAHVFLGDVGSYLFGALAAVGTLVAARAGAPAHIALAPLSLYLFDVAVTLARRTRRRAAVLTAHREHIYQRLQACGPLPHSLVSAFVLVLCTCVAASWALAEPLVGATTTVLVLVLYACSPMLASKLVAQGRRKEASVS